MPELTRLSDDDILDIFRAVVEGEHDAETLPPAFLHCYAEALLLATRRDFMILRPASLVLIAKYKLAAEAESGGEVQDRRSA